ncbi:hypothetical protein H257_00261 [Aphanomyces astaci]|uniref:DDE Tnp4 domain-containing protein n=1 Tax=Aphanomyces astaci TaxID=112090 RepID=W4H9Z4_APHAT|nr:hypothetical protein H257_00261 [Aphanomyces astaci]ETV88747.1 hypothetical protein H257_00261 [Aphanomyces astaci]|eukprot:XP_009821147.1 hypothetical protein H257_00261 [Aphanomyces astaci]
MYATRDPASFISTVPLAPDAFDSLLVLFSGEYEQPSRRGKGGRPPRVFHAHAVLALVLHFYTAAVDQKTLQKLFALTPSTCARTLRKVEEALARALAACPDAAIKWPSKTTQASWAAMSNSREPLVHGVFSFVDGKNLRVQNHRQPICRMQCTVQRVFVTGVLCFGLDGTLVWGRHNCPGSWNDGEISRRLQEILADPAKADFGMKVASDSAFPVSVRCADRIVTPLKKGDLERHPPACRLGLKVMSDCITSLRQAAEWGMGAVSKEYRQLLLPLPLPYNPSLRAMQLESMFKLYNFRVRRTGKRQIKNVFGL